MLTCSNSMACGHCEALFQKEITQPKSFGFDSPDQQIHPGFGVNSPYANYGQAVASPEDKFSLLASRRCCLVQLCRSYFSWRGKGMGYLYRPIRDQNIGQ